MFKWTGIVGLIFLCVSCGDVESTKTSEPPERMVGVWEANENLVSSVDTKDDCANISVGKDFVSTGLFMVNQIGNVYDGKNMKNINEPYRIIGQMDSAGKITPNGVGRREFLGSFADVTNGTFNPVVTSNYGVDPFKGEYLVIKIDLQFISGGQSSTQDWKKIEYYKTTDAGELSVISKAQKCLNKTKGNP